MIVERSMTDSWLSNTYLVAAGPNTDAFLVDAGGPMDPLFAKADEHGLNVTHILLTHHHGDHVAELGAALERWPDATVLAHPEERVPGTTGDLNPGDEVEIGGLTVKALHTPGHTAGMLALLVDGRAVHRRHAVQGLGRRRPRARLDVLRGHQASIMDVILTLPGETVLRPGHTDPSTVADELENNPFVRDLARSRRRGRRAVHGARRPRHAGALGPRLRRRPQGLGALAGRPRRHRSGLQGRALTSMG